MSQKQYSVQELSRDRYSRTATLSIGDKTLNLPNFFPRIKNSDELNSLIHLNSLYPQKFIRAYTTRLSDQPNQILMNKTSIYQKTLDMDSYANNQIREFYNKNLHIIDPSSEYLLYEGADDYLKLYKQLKFINKTEKKLFNVLGFLEQKKHFKENTSSKNYNRWKKTTYKKFWYDLDRNQSEMYKLIGETHDIEIKYDSDLILPFVPVILNEGLLDISIRINKISNAISPIKSATYFILNVSALKNEQIISQLKNYLMSDANDITVFKIKYLELYKPGFMVQREYYRELMETMTYITEENKHKVFVLLEGNIQSFPSASVGFDMVSTSMTGLDGDGVFGTTPYGRWFYPKKLWSIPHEKAIDIFIQNGGSPLCSCPACTDIYRKGPTVVNPSEWNSLRREHYLFTMNDLMNTIVTHISQRKIELIRQFILDSEVPKLAEIIPRM